jgi:hypothetical protein
MKWLAITGTLLALVALWLARWERPPAAELRSSAEPAAAADVLPVERPAARPASTRPVVLTAAEKAARVAKIRADYDAIRKDVTAELDAAGSASLAGPGPFGETRVFLRRLVLLQREERDDLAHVLDARELEDLELRESPAGQLVVARLAATSATEVQCRSVFRLEREFDERFGFVFDLTPDALAERARLRRETDEKIRAVLGQELFQIWAAPAVR